MHKNSLSNVISSIISIVFNRKINLPQCTCYEIRHRCINFLRLQHSHDSLFRSIFFISWTFFIVRNTIYIYNILYHTFILHKQRVHSQLPRNVIETELMFDRKTGSLQLATAPSGWAKWYRILLNLLAWYSKVEFLSRFIPNCFDSSCNWFDSTLSIQFPPSCIYAHLHYSL